MMFNGLFDLSIISLLMIRDSRINHFETSGVQMPAPPVDRGF